MAKSRLYRLADELAEEIFFKHGSYKETTQAARQWSRYVKEQVLLRNKINQTGCLETLRELEKALANDPRERDEMLREFKQNRLELEKERCARKDEKKNTAKLPIVK